MTEGPEEYRKESSEQMDQAQDSAQNQALSFLRKREKRRESGTKKCARGGEGIYTRPQAIFHYF